MTALFKKELFIYLSSMMGYIFIGFFVLVTGLYFIAINVSPGYPLYTETLLSSIMLFLFLVPVLTMRLFADEARQKTDRLLYTSPVSVTQIVTGKFLAAFTIFLIAAAITLIFPVILSLYGKVPVFQTVCGFIGFILLGACFISVGLFISVLTSSQVIAAVATFASLFLMLMIDGIASLSPADAFSSMIFIAAVILAAAILFYNATKHILSSSIVVIGGTAFTLILYFYNPALFDGLIYKILSWFSLTSRYNSFYLGILSISDIVYYITFSTAFIYLAVSAIEKRRWR